MNSMTTFIARMIMEQTEQQRKDRTSTEHTLYAQSFMKNGEKMWKPFWKQMATATVL